MDIYDDDILGPAARDRSPSNVNETGADHYTVTAKHTLSQPTATISHQSPYILAVYSNSSRPTSIGVLERFQLQFLIAFLNRMCVSSMSPSFAD